MNFNKVMLGGNLTRDPELRHLPSGAAIVAFGVASNEKWKDKQSGQIQERATFVDCEAFGRTAEVINEYFVKGRPIFVEGKLRLDQWDDKQSGQKRSKMKVIVESFQFCGGDGPAQGQQQATRQVAKPATTPAYGSEYEPDTEGDIPF